MKGWTGFLALCPDRVRKVIENGPKPLADYPSGALTHKHKDLGIQRYKGGTGRGPGTQKKGHAAVVYYNPDLAHPKYVPDEIPDSVQERHSEEAVRSAFEEL